VQSYLFWFFLFWSFLKKNLKINPVETYFQDLSLLSHAGLVGVTSEEVTSCTLARCMGQGQACGLVPTWLESRQSDGCDSVTPTVVT
jgi:hypothetical protein